VNLYPSIEAEKTQQRNVKRACALLEVSRAADDAHRADSPSTRQLVDTELTEHIRQAHQGPRAATAPRGSMRNYAVTATATAASGSRGCCAPPACTHAPRAASSARRLPTRLPRLVRIWCAGTWPWAPRRSTPVGAGTSPPSRPGRLAVLSDRDRPRVAPDRGVRHGRAPARRAGLRRADQRHRRA
jgi:hypothetical protein